MVPRLLPLLLISFLSLQSISAQNTPPRFSVGLESQFLLAGELNASYDFLLGARGNYFFRPRRKFHPYLSLGFATDIGTTNARMISTDLQLGTQWNFSKRFSLLMSLGANYIDESHSHLLIERKVDWHNTILGLTGQFGANFKISKSLSSTLFFKQINLEYTSIGLGLNYSF